MKYWNKTLVEVIFLIAAISMFVKGILNSDISFLIFGIVILVIDIILINAHLEMVKEDRRENR